MLEIGAMDSMPHFEPLSEFKKYYNSHSTNEEKLRLLIAAKKKYDSWMLELYEIEDQLSALIDVLELSVDEDVREFIIAMHEILYPIETFQEFHAQIVCDSFQTVMEEMLTTEAVIPICSQAQRRAVQRFIEIDERVRNARFYPDAINFVRKRLESKFVELELEERLEHKYSHIENKEDVLIYAVSKAMLVVMDKYSELYSLDKDFEAPEVLSPEKETFIDWYKIEKKSLKKLFKLDRHISRAAYSGSSFADSENDSLKKMHKELLDYGMKDCSFELFRKTLATGKGNLEFDAGCFQYEIGFILFRLRDTGYFNAKAAEKHFNIKLIGENGVEIKGWPQIKQSVHTYKSSGKDCPPHIIKKLNVIQAPKL